MCLRACDEGVVVCNGIISEDMTDLSRRRSQSQSKSGWQGKEKLRWASFVLAVS